MARLLLAVLLLGGIGCGSGEGSDDENTADVGGQTGNVTVNATADNGGTVNVNVADSGDGQVNDTFSDGNVLDPDNAASGDGDLSDFEAECAFCCSDANPLSEASCVNNVEGNGEDVPLNSRGDCPSELLVEAGCSPDLSSPGCFLCKELGMEE